MAETVKQTHPIRGLLWGIVFGIGLTFVLVFTKVISLDLTTMIIVFVAATVVGVLWSIVGPAKQPKGAPPPDPVTVEQRTVPARTDDRTADGGVETASAGSDSDSDSDSDDATPAG